MRVLVTGASGRVADGIKNHLEGDPAYEFVYLDREDGPDVDHVADVADYEAIRPAFDDVDAVIHLAAYPTTDGTWEQVLNSNIIGTRNVLEAAADAGVSDFVFASSIHAAGMWEEENKPDVYDIDDDVAVTVDDQERPDSYYGVSKAYGEDIGRYYVEQREFPEQFYAIRIASIRAGKYDNPYGDAELGVEQGDWERGSEEYVTQVKRLKGTWLSLRDFAQILECCFEDEEVEWGAFFGTSENDRSWFDIEHTKEVLGYEPRDRAEDWQSPPPELVE
jgi:nucleoside-diphosphate-sugar epimerase